MDVCCLFATRVCNLTNNLSQLNGPLRALIDIPSVVIVEKSNVVEQMGAVVYVLPSWNLCCRAYTVLKRVP